MNVRLPLAAVFATGLYLVTFPLHAQYIGPSAMPAVSVEDILKKPIDDQDIQIQGHILRQINSKKYIFSDGTAEIVAEIKPKRFQGLPEINDKTKVEISGEVDTGLNRDPEIEVDTIRVIK